MPSLLRQEIYQKKDDQDYAEPFGRRFSFVVFQGEYKPRSG